MFDANIHTEDDITGSEVEYSTPSDVDTEDWVEATFVATQSNILRIMREATLLEKRAMEVAQAYAKVTGQKMDSDAEIISFDENSIELKWESGCSRGCCHETEYLTVPTRYLWEPEWQGTALADKLETQRKQEEAEKRRQALARQQAEEAAKVRKEREERETLEKLKAKYEVTR